MDDSSARHSTKAVVMQWPLNNKTINCVLNTYSRKALLLSTIRGLRKNKIMFAFNSLT